MSGAVPGPLNLRRRPSRTVPALVASVLLLALGAALCWLAIHRLVEGSWPGFVLSGAGEVGATAWRDPGAWIVGSCLALLGLILLFCGIVPGGFRTMKLRTPPVQSTFAGRQDPGLDGGSAEAGTGADTEADGYPGGSGAVVSRSGVARLAAAACEHIDGVASASATAGDRAVKVRVETALRDTADLHTWVVEGVRSRLEASGLDPVPEVRVEVRSTA